MRDETGERRFDQEWFRVVADVLWLWDLVGRKAVFLAPMQMLDWLDTPNEAFDNRRPIEVLADEGRQKFDSMAHQVLSGQPA